MAAHRYPTSLADISAWAKANQTNTGEASVRFMEFVVLSCMAGHRILRQSVTLKGGNALRFGYGSRRSTKDLDFAVVDSEAVPDDTEQLRDILDTAFARAESRFGVKAGCQRVRRNPPSPAATRPTYDVAVGYQLPGDRYFHDFGGRPVSTVINLEISFNDLVCETTTLSLREEDSAKLKLCALDDIVAEKLRALLQQAPRKRNRPQDVYDIAFCSREFHRELNLASIAKYLQEKSVVRNIAVSKSAFNEEIRDLAARDYDMRIQPMAGVGFIPFDEAWEAVLSLVDSLDIPS